MCDGSTIFKPGTAEAASKQLYVIREEERKRGSLEVVQGDKDYPDRKVYIEIQPIPREKHRQACEPYYTQ